MEWEAFRVFLYWRAAVLLPLLKDQAIEGSLSALFVIFVDRTIIYDHDSFSRCSSVRRLLGIGTTAIDGTNAWYET
jgi:hypothetical protein